MNWTLLIAGMLAVAGPAVTVQPLSGERIEGTLIELNAQGLAVETPAGQVTLPLDKLLLVTPALRPSMTSAIVGVWVELIDGSLLTGSEYTVEQSRARLTRLDGTQLDIDTEQIAMVRFKLQNETIAEQWTEILASESTSDLIVIRKNEAIDYLEGELGGVTAEVVEFTLDGEAVPVKRPKVEGLVYFHPGQPEWPAPVSVVTDTSGSTIQAQTLAASADGVRLTTPAGLEIEQPWTQITSLDFSQGKVQFLSDLEPERVEWTPYLGTAGTLPVLQNYFRPRQDAALDGGPLKLQEQTFAKGLALHSRTLLVYRLPGKFSRFEAVIGIDDSVGDAGHVQLTIHGDELLLLETLLTGRDPPQPIKLDLTGIKRLSILVDFGEEQDVSDHLDLCEARIVK